MYSDVLQEVGLVKNEARIYETLLKEGQSPVGRIASKSGVHRRNVYDTLNRLMEKGLVFEIVDTKENSYQAVDPHKLADILDEKRGILNDVMPELSTLYKTQPAEHAMYTYRGAEGWKNYMMDILKVGEPAYFIGAKGAWLDERVKDFFPTFIKEAEKKNLEYFHLFDHRVEMEAPEILEYVGKHYKFLPKEYETPSSIDLFGDRVNILTELHMGRMAEDIVFSVIVNQNVADSFRTWFKLMWNLLPERKGARKKL